MSAGAFTSIPQVNVSKAVITPALPGLKQINSSPGSQVSFFVAGFSATNVRTFLGTPVAISVTEYLTGIFFNVPLKVYAESIKSLENFIS